MDLLAAFTYLDEQRMSRDARKKKIDQRVEMLSTTLERKALQKLRIVVSKEVRAESDNDSFDLACDLLIQDAMRIWQGEVGTSILVFLT